MNDINKDLSNWTANSAHFDKYPELTLRNAQLYPELLFQLEKQFGGGKQLQQIVTSEKFATDLSERFKQVFDRYGSDKSRVHDYQHCYSHIASRIGLDKEVRILEIGIGTNNVGLVSTMGARGIPGASLRAWKELFPNAMIFGADIDSSILFEEERISTHYVDQFDFATLENLLADCGGELFDFIIDDGLHSISANLNTLLFSLSAIKKDGWIVIEDIARKCLPLLCAIDKVLAANKDFKTMIVRTRRTFLYVVQKLA